KRVLDIGCADGKNATLFAKLGANVVGVDISPRQIDLAGERARMSGVADKVEFVCSPIETADFEENSFDVIWGDGVLHHLVDEIDEVMRRSAAWALAAGVIGFRGPLNPFSAPRHRPR